MMYDGYKYLYMGDKRDITSSMLFDWSEDDPCRRWTNMAIPSIDISIDVLTIFENAISKVHRRAKE